MNINPDISNNNSNNNTTNNVGVNEANNGNHGTTPTNQVRPTQGPSLPKEFVIPQRQLTKEEINRCYLRWQQLRSEHGVNAVNVTEFVYYTEVLKMAAKQQQEQKQKQATAFQLQQQQQQQQLVQQQQQQQQEKQNINSTNMLESGRSQANTPANVVSPNIIANGNSGYEQGTAEEGNLKNSGLPRKNSMAVSPHSQMQFDNTDGNSSNVFENQQGAGEEYNNNGVPMTKTPSANASRGTAISPAQNSSFNSQQQPQHFQQQQQLQQQQQQNQQQNPQQQNPQQNQQQNPQQNQQESHNPVTNIFSQEQTTLLKAQISAMKYLLAKQSVPVDFQTVINDSVTHPPNYKEILMVLSETMKKRKEMGPVDQQKQAPVEVQPPVPKVDPKVLEAQQKALKLKLDQEAKEREEQQKKEAEERERKRKEEEERQKKIKEEQERLEKKRLLLSEVPTPLEKFKQAHPDPKIKIINVTDPELKVESYTLPEAFPKHKDSLVPYKELFSPDAKIMASSLPIGLDIQNSLEIYQTLIALNTDTEVNNTLLQLLNCNGDEGDEDEKKREEKLIYKLNSLNLIPLQKAVRGHILSFEGFQRSLVANAFPTFVSKERLINIEDVKVTNNLFAQHEIIQQEIMKQHHTARVNNILDECARQLKSKQDRKNKRLKFGNKITSLHANLEKEEQKRVERNAKQRLQALKANDEEAYIKLLDQTKDTRITHLLKQTNSFLNSLTKAVKDQQVHTKSLIKDHVKEETSTDALDTLKEANEKDEYTEESENDDGIDYYSVAHRIQEEVTVQPSILIGGTLKDYQLKGLQWMVSLFNNHLNGILADEMGLGKTVQTIALLTYLYEVKKVKGPFLVIVPLSTLTNWNSEFVRWAPKLRKIAYKGTPAERKSLQKQIKAREFDVVLTTFEYIIREKNILSKIKWVHMIIDEGHRMKNAQSKLSLTLNTYYHCDYRLILTGTPLQNNLPELWALLNFVLPKIFNSVKSFDEWFNTPFDNTGGQDKIELSEEETLLVIRRLHKVLRPFLLRRLKKDVEKELPQKVEKVLKCRMSSLQQKLYEQMLKYKKLFLEEDETLNEDDAEYAKAKKKGLSARGFNNQIMQLKKICNHPYVFEEVEDSLNPTRETDVNIWRVAGKFELLQRILPKCQATNHRVLLFFQMTQVMDIMEDFLRFMGIKYLRLDGSTKADDRTILLNLFNAPDSEYFCFLLSTRAGGLGLNLQTADTVIIFDSDWNPHQDLQAQDRAHRIGQKNEVRILRLITQNSVEEAILEKAYKKLDIDGKVIQAGKFDNKSTSEEQEQILRQLMKSEEERKRKRDLGEDEDDELEDDELNAMLSRNDDEIAIFKKLDEERIKTDMEQGVLSRLMEESELPEVYKKDIDAEIQREADEAAAANAEGVVRERKRTNYNEESEEQWLKQFEVSDDEGDGSKPRRYGFMKKKENSVEPSTHITEISEDNVGEVNAASVTNESESVEVPSAPVEEDKNVESKNSDDDEYEDSGHKTVGSKRRAGKTRAPLASKKIKTSASIRKGRPPKVGKEYARIVVSEGDEEESDVLEKAKELYDYIYNYENSAGRRLSDIFLEKPDKNDYPDYYKIIRNVVAFETVTKNIEDHCYSSLLQVLEDFHLIFSNARVYNAEGSILYNDSLELEDFAIKKYIEMSGAEESSINFTLFDDEFATPPLKLKL